MGVKRVVIWAPALVLIAFVAIAALRMARPGDTTHGSRIVGRPVPVFALAPAASSRPGLTSGELRGKPRLLNIFASWCVPCIAEVPVLVALATKGVTVDGIAIRDRRDDLDTFLTRHGNPYRAIGLDPQSTTQIALGSAGVPETFVIDRRGVVRYQHIGAIGLADLDRIERELIGAAR